jgi:pyruvate,water dikinase
MASTDIIGWFADLGLEDRSHVGGKGGSLGELQRGGIAVPPGFVVKTGGFRRFIDALERDSALRAPIGSLPVEDLAGATAVCEETRRRIERSELPSDVADEIAAAYAQLFENRARGPVAVRSSATTEDSADASFAGLQDTYLWVTHLEDLLLKVRSCWASLYSVASVTYRRRHGLPEDGVAMAVVVQEMVNARAAGVMFTRSPMTGDRSVITIEGAWGLGSAVVGGEVTPDRWVIGKITGEISVREIADKQQRHVPAAGGGIQTIEVPAELRRAACLSDDEIQGLRKIGRQVERQYGHPQDIEWAVEEDTHALLLLQSRPETVWSNKEAAPVAPPVSDPLLHVMTIFGGRR